MEGKGVRVYGAVAEYLARKYGGVFYERVELLPVTGSFTELLKADPERILIIFVNTEAAGDLVIVPTSLVGAGVGIEIDATKDREFNVDDHGLLPTVAWSGVHNGGANIMAITVRREFEVKADHIGREKE